MKIELVYSILLIFLAAGATRAENPGEPEICKYIRPQAPKPAAAVVTPQNSAIPVQPPSKPEERSLPRPFVEEDSRRNVCKIMAELSLWRSETSNRNSQDAPAHGPILTPEPTPSTQNQVRGPENRKTYPYRFPLKPEWKGGQGEESLEMPSPKTPEPVLKTNQPQPRARFEKY
jgi:hypothetical protein